MARNPHPQDKAGDPPEDRRCTATVTSHQPGAPYRCTQWTLKGQTVCISHSDKRPIPSHNPPPERRCNGKSVGPDGHRTQPCKLWAMRGLTVCWRHGGADPRKRAVGEQRVAEEKVIKKARQLCSLFSVEPVDNPLTALSQVAGEAVLFKEILQGMVSELEDVSSKGLAGEQIRPTVVVYERALDRVGSMLEKIARLNIDERLAAINEKQAETVIAAIDAALAHVGITGEQATDAKKVAARYLRAA